MEKTWVKSRNKDKRGLPGRNIKYLAVAFLCALLSVSFVPGTSRAELAAPAWMPNSPILAGSQIIVLWLPVPGATKYNIYMNGEKVGEATGVQLVVATPEEAGEYIFEIAAIDPSGKEWARSVPGKINIISIEPPKNVAKREIQDRILLRWDKAKGAVIHNIYRAENKSGPFELLQSVQTDSFTDSAVEAGKKYYYTITSKDLAGKESKRSTIIEASIKVDVGAVDAQLELKILPTRESSRIGFISGVQLAQISDVKVLQDREEVWIVKDNKIFRVGYTGDVLGVIGPVEGVGKFVKLDIGPDGSIYISDTKGFLYSMGDNGAIRWKSQIPRPPLGDKDIWRDIPDHYKKYNPVGGDVLALDDEIWISDQRYAVICVFDYNGNFQRYIYEFTNKEGNKIRFPNVGEFEETPGGKNAVITFPIAHFAVVVDRNMKEVFSIGKVGTGFIGRFIGIAGIYVHPDGNILLTDPAVNSMQVFDGKTGKYLYHIGGEEAKEDPDQPGRAFLSFGGISFAQFLNETDMVVYTGSEKKLLFRKMKNL